MEKNVINKTSTHNVSLDWFFVNVCSDPAPNDVHALGAVRSYMDFCWVHAGRWKKYHIYIKNRENLICMNILLEQASHQ